MVPMMFLQPRRLSPGFRAPPTQPLHLELSLEKKRQLKLNPSNVKPSWRELLGFHAHSWGRRNYLPGGTLLCRDLTLSLLEGRVCLSRGGGRHLCHMAIPYPTGHLGPPPPSTPVSSPAGLREPFDQEQGSNWKSRRAVRRIREA